MRAADTYRAAKRQRVKVFAKDCGVKFIAMWREQEVPLKPWPYDTTPRAGKTYAANGTRECARRLRQQSRIAA